MKSYKYILIFVGLIISIISCSKMIEVDMPADRLIASTVFESDYTAKAAIAGLYAKLITNGKITSGGNSGLSFQCGLTSDELGTISTDAATIQYFQNNIIPTNPFLSSSWDENYSIIFSANSILEGTENAPNVSPSLKQQMRGEALFIRAFIHFYLVNLFGEVPYVTTTRYAVNSNVTRLPVPEVYQMIIADINKSKDLLVDDYSFSFSEKVRINKSVADALLARVYLYLGDWQNAEDKATKVIDNIALFELEDDIDNVFLKNSSEAIWQLQPSFDNFTNEGDFFLNYGTHIYLSDALVQSMNDQDQRKTKWTTQRMIGASNRYEPFKYKDDVSSSSLEEYYMVFRLAEQYLIRAEARARMGNFIGPNSAETDLNMIHERAGLAPLSAASADQMVDLILMERKWELFAEWGHRWFDLKRLQMQEQILSSIKPGWNINDTIFPLPYQEVLANPNMRQNKGY